MYGKQSPASVKQYVSDLGNAQYVPVLLQLVLVQQKRAELRGAADIGRQDLVIARVFVRRIPKPVLA
jgi:hypothetical protein